MSSPKRSLAILLVLVLTLNGVLSICGLTGRKCIRGRATCVGGECQCKAPKYVWGDGTFMCYRRNQVAAEVRNDPFLTTYNNETADFHYPCRYMLGHVRQKLKDRHRNVIGTCEFQVHGFNRKHKGKFYAYGFDAAIRLTFDDDEDYDAISVRNYGTVVTGRTYEGTRGQYLPDGPWGSDNVNYTNHDYGIYIYNYFDERNQQMVFEAPQCGLRVTFVPYHEILRRNWPHVPGLSVAVNCAHSPVWLSKSVTMGLPPVWQGGQLLADIQYPWLSIPQSVVVRAFESGIAQVQPDAPAECTSGQARIAACNDVTRAQAMESCFWMLEQSRFMKCMDEENSVTNLLTLFIECVRTFCEPQGNALTCRDVADAVKTLGCGYVPRIPILASFSNYDLCPAAP